MFNLFKPFDILTIKSSGIVVYSPLINYNWSTTTTSGLRYLKDVGSTPTYNASMYFGRGAYLNGVDQSITVPINATIQTSLKRVNGVVTINETSQTLTNYVISGLGVHKDYYLFTRLLTTAEKDSYTNTPEAFYAMAQADSTCVLNMPMCETDGYVRNMKSYSEGSDIAHSLTYINSIDGTGNTATNIANIQSVHLEVPTTVSYRPYFRTNITFDTNINYVLSWKIKVTSGTMYLSRLEYSPYNGGDSILTIGKTYGVGEYEFIAIGRGRSNGGITLISDGTSYYNTNYTIEFSAKQITAGIYPISNYTSSVRDNAKNLQYGLQTCKFVRDGLGVIQSASNYLECDGTGYAIIPSHTDTVNIKMTVNPTSLSGNLLSGGVTKTLTGLTLNIDNDVVISNVTPTGAITLASGFSGTIKTYTEELV